MTANGSALLCYAMTFSLKKLAQVRKSNTAGFLRIQRHNRKILENTKRTTEITGIDQNRFPD